MTYASNGLVRPRSGNQPSPSMLTNAPELPSSFQTMPVLTQSISRSLRPNLLAIFAAWSFVDRCHRTQVGDRPGIGGEREFASGLGDEMQ